MIAAGLAAQSTARTDGWPAYPGAPNIDHQPQVVGLRKARESDHRNYAMYQVMRWRTMAETNSLTTTTAKMAISMTLTPCHWNRLIEE